MNYNKLKEIRKDRGYTQDFIAEKMGYSNKSSYSMLETGRVKVDLEKAKRLKIILNLSDGEFEEIFLS